MDASPYDNMPLVVQKSQIFINIACTYFFGKNGIKIIPNIRLGDNRTLSALEAFPRHTLIAIGTNGFVKLNENKIILANQVEAVARALEPKGICVYGPAKPEIFKYPKSIGIPIFQFDSYTMKENKKDKKRILSGCNK